MITLLETVDSALGLWRKELCRGPQVWQMPISVEGSGRLQCRAPPHSAQALGNTWELYLVIITPAPLFFLIKIMRAPLFLINSSVVLSLEKYNVNGPWGDTPKEKFTAKGSSLSPKCKHCLAFPLSWSTGQIQAVKLFRCNTKLEEHRRGCEWLWMSTDTPWK